MKEQRPKRTEIATLRLTKEERRTLMEEADTCGLSLSSYIRQRSFGRRITANIDLRVLGEVRRLGGLLKHIHNETRGAYSAKTAKAIDEINAFIHLMNEELINRNRKNTP